MDTFARRLLAWYDQNGRHELPWQQPRTAYRVWVSEVMLQQTQVGTVLPYFEKFMAALPNLRALADANADQVLALWSGLGYYRRARYLHDAARLCVLRHDGELPRDFTALTALPGIGRSTAGAILALTFAARHTIVDGNVKRVLARYHGVRGWAGERAVEQELWQLAEAHTPADQVADYTQAIMDLGALVCTRARPRCTSCPQARGCVARRDDSTAEIPAPKPARAKPERHATLLILRDHADRVLLQRRPPHGVWPSLWSLPQADDHSAATSMAVSLAILSAAPPTAVPEFKHEFTHFRLRITALEWHAVAAHAGVADAADNRWASRAEMRALGMPAPVRKLLRAER